MRRVTQGGGTPWCAWALGAALLVGNPCAAAAHAIILESEPVAGAKLVDPPARILLRFNSRLEKHLSRVTLTAADGRPVPLPVKADGSETADRITLPLVTLPPGEYVVRYKVLAVDGHITEGALRFTVLAVK